MKSHLHLYISPTLLLLFLLVSNLVVAHKAKENRRDFQKFDKTSLGRIAELNEQWESVDEGHLKRLLIPRAGTSVLKVVVIVFILIDSWFGK
jgi:hypothetical protein